MWPVADTLDRRAHCFPFFKKKNYAIMKWEVRRAAVVLCLWDMFLQTYDLKFLCKNVKNLSAGNYNLVYKI